MARLVLLDDPEDPNQQLVLANEAVAQQDLDLAIAALLGERDHAAKPFEEGVGVVDRPGFEIVDPRTEHDLDEPVDMAARSGRWRRA
jgi:hypothetical protein